MGPFKHRKKRSTDVTVTGDLVQGAWRLAEEAGWLVELEELCGSGWKNKEEGKEERGKADVKGELAGNFVLAMYSGLLLPAFIACDTCTPVSVVMCTVCNTIDNKALVCVCVHACVCVCVRACVGAWVRGCVGVHVSACLYIMLHMCICVYSVCNRRSS